MTDEPELIAVVGMDCRFPGADSPERFWANLCAGTESLTTFDLDELRAVGVDPAHLDHPDFVPVAGVLEDIDLFDPEYFGYSPREAELLDPQHRLFLECAVGALERAGIDPRRRAEPIGVYGGAGLSGYMWNNVYPNAAHLADVSSMQLMMSVDKDFLASRVAYKLDLRGPAVSVQTACSTSLVAIHLATQGLLTWDCDIALAGGVSLVPPESRGYRYESDGVLSPDGHCRPFDAAAAGTVPSSGVGIVVLRRLSDAVSDGDQIHAVVRGTAMNNDGAAKVGYTAPSTRGQAQVITDALLAAGVAPDTIGYVEAHGAATPLGDPIETAALGRAFDALGGADRRSCAIGSVKSNVGHLDAAAGVAGFIKAVMAVRHGLIPPTLHHRTANPNVDLNAGPFYVNTELRTWQRSGAPRRAGVSSFGIGGTNAHVVIEEPPPVMGSAPKPLSHAVVLSARTPGALDRVTGTLADHLAAHPDLDLADVAGTLATGRTELPYRKAVVGRDTAEIAALLDARTPGRVYTGTDRAASRTVVFLFSGVGDQYPGMTAELYRDEPVFRAAFDQCADTLRDLIGADLRTLSHTDPLAPVTDPLAAMFATRPETALTRTRIAQPLLFATQYAMAQLWLDRGVRPDALLGHSVGEYVAACVAGVFTLDDALRVIARRALWIEEMPAGGMLAVLSPEDTVAPLLGARLSVAAVESPDLTVVAGPAEDLAELAGRLTADGVASRQVPASHAFHSAHLRPLEPKLRTEFARCGLNPPSTPLLSNLTGTWLTDEEAVDPGFWAAHVHRTVRFADEVGEMWRLPSPVVVSMGPGRALGGLVTQHPGRAPDGLVLSTLRGEHDTGSDRTTLLEALSRAWLSGVPVDWNRVHEDTGWRRVTLPTYAFERQRLWLSARQPAARRGRVADATDWFAIPSWRTTVPPAGAPGMGRLLVIGGELPALVGALWRGPVVTAVPGPGFAELAPDRFQLAPASVADWVRLLTALRDNDSVPDTVLFGLPADRPPTGDPLSSFHGLALFARAVGECRLVRPIDLCVLTAHGLATPGCGTELVPEHAMLSGLCRVVSQELPQVRCRQVDVAPEPAGWQRDRLVRTLSAELAARCDETVAYRSGQRLVQEYRSVALPEGAPDARLRPGGCYLLVGGLGRIGRVVARYLAEHASARIGLVRRTPVLSAEDLLEIRELERLGATVASASADLADADAFGAAVADIERALGRIDGVFHVAGVVSEETVMPLADASVDACAVHLPAKVTGPAVLASTLAGRELDFVVLSSSIAAVLGGVGLGAYAAANAYLSAFAYRQSLLGPTPWCALDWEGWTTDGDGPTARTLREYLIDEDDATSVLRRVLTSGLPPELVNSAGDLALRLDQWVRAEPGADAEPATGTHPRPNLQTGYVAPRDPVETQLAAIWARLFGIDELGVHDNFFELGGHSLLATRVMAAVLAELRVQVPLHTLLSAPTIAEQAAEVARMGAAPPAPITKVDRSRYRVVPEASA